MGKRITNEEFVAKVYEVVGNEYEVLREYINTRTKIKMKHIVCGNEYEVTPNSFLSSGRRCPTCSSESGANKRKKTNEKFIEEVFYLVADEYVVMSKYVDLNTKVKMKHVACNETYETTPKNFKGGSRCPICYGNQKKTTEIFKKEVIELVGFEYCVLGEYETTHTKIRMKHEKCGHVYNVQPSNFLSGQRCPECYGNKKKTTEIFKKEVYEKVKDEYIVVSEYKNIDTCIEMKHTICGYEYEVTPYNFLSRGSRCPMCIKGMRKITEIFKKQVYGLENDKYVVSSEYINDSTHVTMEHLDCGHIYKVTPSNFLRGRRCPLCNGNAKKTTESFNKEVYDLVGTEYSFLEEYESSHKKIKVKHIACGNVYRVSPSKFLLGRRCPRCAYASVSNKLKSNHNEYVNKIHALVMDEYQVLGKYENSRTKIKMKHITCNHEWEITPNNFLQGQRCPNCKLSKGEKEISEYLTHNHIKHEPQKSFTDLIGLGGGLLSYDFYLPYLNLLIEYDGEFHYKPVHYTNEPIEFAKQRFRKQQEHDSLKDTYAKNNNINLLRIPYWEFNNIEEILHNYLVEPMENSNGSFLVY